MTENRSKVLVLGSDTRSFLTVIRSLGRSGKEVHVAWCARDSVALKSKYVAAHHHVTRPPGAGWQKDFLGLLEREQFRFVIPCNDPSILPLHLERDTFDRFPIYLIPAAIFESAMDKAAVNRIAKSVNVTLPREVLIESTDDISRLEQIPPPFVLKPTRSYVATRLSQKNHVQVTGDYDSATAALREMLGTTPVAVQAYFEGIGVGVEFLAKQGELLFAFQHERLHEPPEGGGSSLRKSSTLDPQLRSETERLVRAMDYTGVGMAEFRFNRDTGDWIFVELNSRFWGSLPLAVSCGADFPSFLYQMWCENREKFPDVYRENRSCRNWMLDIRWLSKMLQANGISPAAHLRLAFQLIKDMRFPLTLRESSDTLTWDDPRPGIEELRNTLAQIPRRIRRKTSRLGFIRRRSRENGIARLRKAQSVLFVCKGNICRSPFAAHYAKANLPAVQAVQSCGYFPKSGRPSPDNAQTAASRFDVDLGSHRSQVVSSELVDAADAIVVFDDENREEMHMRFPDASKKFVMLGSILDQGDVAIGDPYGGEVDVFEKTYARIAQALDRISN